MSIERVKRNLRSQEKSFTPWDEAIRDAKLKIRKLQASIRVFRENKKAGETWPGSTGTTV
jgi:hypothetical protein